MQASMASPKKRPRVDVAPNPTPSSRIHCADTPCIVGMKTMLENAPKPPMSLAQGIVHWTPPPEAITAAKEALELPHTSGYGDDNGNPELRRALKEKLRNENSLVNSEVMVTAGANQAYMNIVIAALDAGDAAVLFKPYYFNHIMALQVLCHVRLQSLWFLRFSDPYSSAYLGSLLCRRCVAVEHLTERSCLAPQTATCYQMRPSWTSS